MITEAMIKAEIREYLNALPRCWRVAFQATGFGRRGIPDELVCYRGMFLAFEVKRPPDSAKPAKRNPDAEKWQRREIASIRAAGGRAEIVWTLEQVKAVIAEVDAVLGPAEFTCIHLREFKACEECSAPLRRAMASPDWWRA